MAKKEGAGVYHNDYSPRYQPAYDIYEKARQHVKNTKRIRENEVQKTEINADTLKESTDNNQIKSQIKDQIKDQNIKKIIEMDQRRVVKRRKL